MQINREYLATGAIQLGSCVSLILALATAVLALSSTLVTVEDWFLVDSFTHIGTTLFPHFLGMSTGK